MKVTTLYGVILQSSDGGQRMNSFLSEESAVNESMELIKQIKDSGLTGVKVYLSELDYDKYNNRLLTSKLINSESELLFSN